MLEFLFLGLILSTPFSCKIEIEEQGNYLLVEKSKILLPLERTGLKIKSCERWKEFPGLLVAEIDYEEEGEFTDLFVFDLKSNGGKKLFQYTTFESRVRKERGTQKQEKILKKRTPILSVSSDKQPQIQFKDSKEIFILDRAH